jgi:D-sedoheptulose 7-phosphate isomerase
MDTQAFVTKYNNEFCNLPASFEASDKEGDSMPFAEGIDKCVQLVLKAQADNKKVMMVGNGGSAGITSHLAVDFWKNGGIKATAFNDSSLLTCISNDFSYEEVFAKPIEAFGEAGDILMAISSSGNSANILKAADAAHAKGCSVITLSGFGADNKLRAKGDVNFYVPALSYGFAEVLHTYIIHCILDAKMYCHDKVDVFNRNLPL